MSCLHMVLPGPGSELWLCWKPIGIKGFSRGSASWANRPGGWPRLGSAKAGGGEGTTGPAQDFSFLILLLLFIWLKADLKSSDSTAWLGPRGTGAQVQLPGFDLLASICLWEPLPQERQISSPDREEIKVSSHVSLICPSLQAFGFYCWVCDQIKHRSIWWSSLSSALIASLKPHHTLTVFKPLTKCFSIQQFAKVNFIWTILKCSDCK